MGASGGGAPCPSKVRTLRTPRLRRSELRSSMASCWAVGSQAPPTGCCMAVVVAAAAAAVALAPSQNSRLCSAPAGVGISVSLRKIVCGARSEARSGGSAGNAAHSRGRVPAQQSALVRLALCAHCMLLTATCMCAQTVQPLRAHQRPRELAWSGAEVAEAIMTEFIAWPPPPCLP